MKKSFIVLIVICSLLGIVGLLYKNNIIFNNKDISKEEDYSNIPYDTKDDVFNFKEDVVSLNTCEEIYKNYYNEKDGIMHLFEDFSYSVDYILNNKDKFNHPLIKCSDITFNDYAQDFIGAQGFCYEGEDIKLFNFYNFTNNEIMKEAEYFSTDYKRNDFILESQIYQLTKENKIIYVDNNLNIVTYDTKSKTPVYFISELNFFLLEYDNFIYPRLYVTNDNKLYTFNEIDATEWYKYKYLKSFTDNVKNKYNLYLNSYGNLLYYSEYDYDYNNVTPNILTDENNNNIKISKVILILIV